MIAEHRKKATIFIALGLVGLIGGIVVQLEGAPGSAVAVVGFAIRLAGLASFLYGCVSYAKAKGRHWAWGLLGLFNLFGLVALWLLVKDKSAELPAPSEEPQA